MNCFPHTECPKIARNLFAGLVFCMPAAGIVDAQNLEQFSVDPRWDGFRNRLLPRKLPVTTQQFGYRTSQSARGNEPGEIGGTVQRSVTRAYYAKLIATKTLNDKLTASGKFSVTRAAASSGVMVGWFHHASSRGWRTPNSIAMRVDGNGGKYWVFYEYGTSKRHTGGGGAFEGRRYQTTKTAPFPADGTAHRWSLGYDPDGSGGLGLVTFTVNQITYHLSLAPERPPHETHHSLDRLQQRPR